MFKNQDENREIETIIGPSVTVEGDFVAAGDIIVEGTVSGKITTERNLRIGPNAKIFANISAANVIIAGEVQGNVKAKDSVELADSAKLFGDVKAKSIGIALGAVLHGRCQTGDEKKSKFEKIESLQKNIDKESVAAELVETEA